MVIAPQLYTARVMHKRLFPKENTFNYNVYYLALPLPAKNIKGLFTNFNVKDIGLRDGSDPLPWARSILAEYGLDKKIKDIMLITMPRILGYVFNPISFYLCLNNHQQLISVLCEVHNTFGEQHTYLCAHANHQPILAQDCLEAEKVFHVSPFLNKSGHYKFRFDLSSKKLGVWIDYYDSQNNKQLITSLVGHFEPLTQKILTKAFWQHPLVTFKAITFIHWQALKLVLKGIKYITKPIQINKKITTTRNLNKM
jgi:uncharacterized protein